MKGPHIINKFLSGTNQEWGICGGNVDFWDLTLDLTSAPIKSGEFVGYMLTYGQKIEKMLSWESGLKPYMGHIKSVENVDMGTGLR